MADQLSTQGEVTPIRRGMDMVGWTPERELLSGILEAVLRQTAWLVGVHGKDHKVPKVNPLPRPRTAIERVRRRREEEEVAAIVAAFKPRE